MKPINFAKLSEGLLDSQKAKIASYSLSNILLRSALLTYFMFAIIITSLQLVIEYHAIKQDIMRQLQSLTITFEPAAANALWDIDTELMEAVVNGMGANQTVISVEVVDLDGDIQVSWRDASKLNDDTELISVAREIYYRDNGNAKHLGSIKVSSSQRILYALLKDKMESGVLSDLVLLLGFYLLMWLFIRFLVVNPLAQFSNQLSNLPRAGQQISIAFKAVKVSEIKSLQDSFNQLLQLLLKREELIWHQANYDTLTNLPNRHLFQDRLEQEAKKAERMGTSLALFFIDLDGFKTINDTSGHAVGDILLNEAGQRISHCVRETDTIARLGGDEYTVILPDVNERSYIECVAKDIIDAISQPFELESGNVVYISASIGIAIYPEDTNNLGELMKQADQAMYSVKAHGKSHFKFFALPMQKEVQDKLTLTNHLRKALVNRELEVHYQPIVDVNTGQIHKAEALLRWEHPTLGHISPDIFIPIAEESKLIIEIGEWVFQEVILNIQHWKKALGRIVQVSVNMSPLQFELPSDEVWLDMLKESQLPNNSLTIEITEGLLIKDSIKVKQRLLDFRNKGIEVSIDDFGTGFSALSYLKQFDIDYLKIDRAFITNLTVDASDKALTEAIIVMAHKLGIKTIAEGVETEAQRALLIDFGCDYIQGFLYSKPVDGKSFERLLKA